LPLAPLLPRFVKGAQFALSGGRQVHLETGLAHGAPGTGAQIERVGYVCGVHWIHDTRCGPPSR
jgi:hypothetical protein